MCRALLLANGRLLYVVCAFIEFVRSSVRERHPDRVGRLEQGRCAMWRELLCFCEKMIDLFERQVRRLRVTVVDQWYEGEVEAHEDQVRLPLKIVESRRRDHDNDEIP